MNPLKQLWLTLRSNPVFVAAWTAFAGALVPQIEAELSTGKLDWTAAGAQHMLATAGVTAALSVLHLYFPAPGATPTGH